MDCPRSQQAWHTTDKEDDPSGQAFARRTPTCTAPVHHSGVARALNYPLFGEDLLCRGRYTLPSTSNEHKLFGLLIGPDTSPTSTAGSPMSLASHWPRWAGIQFCRFKALFLRNIHQLHWVGVSCKDLIRKRRG